MNSMSSVDSLNTKFILVGIVVLLAIGCGLNPEIVRLNQDARGDENSSARICGDSRYSYALIYFENITANVIAINDQLAPAIMEEKVLARKRRPKLGSYCLETSPGQHQILVLAERAIDAFTNTMFTGAGRTYYFGECAVLIESGRIYVVEPDRGDSRFKDVSIRITEKQSGESVSDCSVKGSIADGAALYNYIDRLIERK